MSGRLFAIGDIHAHYTELMDLYQKLLDGGLVPERDTLIQVGDLVDGGPDTARVLDQVIEWSEKYPHWVFLRGNHEQMMLDALDDPKNYVMFHHWYDQGGEATARSYLPDTLSDYERAIANPIDFIDPQHIAWLRRRPLFHETETYYFVHAGFNPNYPLSEQTEEDMLWFGKRSSTPGMISASL